MQRISIALSALISHE